MNNSCGNFYVYRTGFQNDSEMEQDFTTGVVADECELEYMVEKLYEKVDLCIQYIPPQTFQPHNFYDRLKRHAQWPKGNIKFMRLWSLHARDGIINNWFEGKQ